MRQVRVFCMERKVNHRLIRFPVFVSEVILPGRLILVVSNNLFVPTARVLCRSSSSGKKNTVSLRPKGINHSPLPSIVPFLLVTFEEWKISRQNVLDDLLGSVFVVGMRRLAAALNHIQPGFTVLQQAQ